MRQLLTYLTIGLAAATTAAASEDVTIFMPDIDDSLNDRRISPDSARSILARRLGWLGSLTVGDANDQLLRDLENFGGQQPVLFEDFNQGELSHKLLVVVQGFDPAKKIHTEAKLNRVTVTGASSDFMESTFLHGLLSEPSAQRPNSPFCSYQMELDKHTTADLLLRNMEGSDCPAKEPFLRKYMSAMFDEGSDIERLRYVVRDHFGDVPLVPGQQVSAVLRISGSSKSKKPYSSYKHIIPILSLAKSSILDATVVILPGKHWNKSPFPTTQTQLHSHRRHSSHHASTKLARNSNNTQSNHTLSTLLPMCYATNETCTARTDSCSGHGYCYLKRQGAAKGSECYACKCLRTVDYTNPDDGTQKTIQWGGPACQKKDVSMPFWLLGGFTLLLVFGIWFGIGLLWKMGEEELPSVLSAGVTSQRGQK